MAGMDEFYADMHLGIERNRAAAERVALEDTQRRTVAQLMAEKRDLRGHYDDLVASTAGNLALRYALATALAKLDPTHPLVQDADLRDRIVRHAKHTIVATGDWDQVREVGRTFKIPGRS